MLRGGTSANAGKDIGGLDLIIHSLQESVIYPLVYPNLFASSDLLGPPKGVLFYGPPGCGKTMLAKALARESKSTFINLHGSLLLAVTLSMAWKPTQTPLPRNSEHSDGKVVWRVAETGACVVLAGQEAAANYHLH